MELHATCISTVLQYLVAQCTGYFIVILGISSHTCHLELHAVAFVLHCVLQVGVLHCYISVSYIKCIIPNIVHSSNVNHAMHCINFDAWFQESQMHRETVTRDKGCYKTEASPAVSDKGGKDKRGGEEGGGLTQQEAGGEEGDVGENKPW